MVGAGEGDRREQVERDLTIRLWVVDRRGVCRGLEPLVIRVAVRERKWLAPTQEVVHDSGVKEYAIHAEGRVRGRTYVAHRLELVPHPRRLERLLVWCDIERRRWRRLVRRLVEGRKLSERGLGGKHAALHGGVRSLNLGYIEKASGTSDQRTAGEAQLRDALKAALIERACAVCEPLAALECGPHRRVCLPPLEFLEGVEVRVGIVQADDESRRDERIALLIKVVQEGTAPRRRVHWPPGCVLDGARLVLRRVDTPELLKTDAIRLRLA
mmetsp:Transcript_24813/g.63205  ORF Transcript_24813/g.63205 Transcript_24813/m.63205 type:complete len:270 (+) Transcript_24813:546-1355(+)